MPEAVHAEAAGEVTAARGVGVTAAQDELELGIPEPAMTEADVIKALHERYGREYGNGRRYAVAGGVRSHAGFDARRTADFIAMDLWPSGGLALHGHEVKVSRSDWLRELAEPEKAAEFIPYMNYWWAVVSGPRIVRDGELPDGWGLMVMRGGRLVTARKAPEREAQPLTPSRLAALLRAVAQTSGHLATRQAERDFDRRMAAEKARREALRLDSQQQVTMCVCPQFPGLGPCEHQPPTGQLRPGVTA